MNPKETGYLRILVERGFIGFQQAAELESARQSDEAGDPSKAVWDLAVELGHVTQRQSAEALTVLDSGSSAGTSAGRQGRELGGYELISRLGQGAMGAVYKARQKSLNRLVALKVLPKQLAKDGEFINRFMREARAAGMVSHPNIVAGIDAGCADGYHYLAMEYVDGIDLGARLDRDGRLEESEAVAICIQIAEALEHAHRNGLVHRDVKPENVLVTEDGTAKLCDLGLARLQTESMRLTQSGLAVGTANYMSPEQVRGGDADGRSDVYSLGCVLYHLVTGQTPHQGDSALTVMQKHVGEEAAKVTAVRPELSKALEAVVAKMMAREPSKRYETAGDAAADLRRVASGEVPEALRAAMAARSARHASRAVPVAISEGRIPAATRRQRPAARRGSWLLISVIGAGLLSVGVAGFIWGRSGATPVPQLPPPEKPPEVTVTPPDRPSLPEKQSVVLPAGQRMKIVLRQGDPVPELGIASYTGTADTSLGGEFQGQEFAHGAHEGLTVGRSENGPSGDGPGARSIIRFDLGALPRGAIVERAELDLRIVGLLRWGVCPYRVTSPWEPSADRRSASLGATWTYALRTASGNVPWKTPGGDYDSSIDWGQGPNGLVARPESSEQPGALTFDVTGVVRSWVEGKYENHGFLLVPRATGTKIGLDYGRLFSSEAPSSLSRPTLTLTIVMPATTEVRPPVSVRAQGNPDKPAPASPPQPLPAGRTRLVLRQGTPVPELGIPNYAGTTDTTLSGEFNGQEVSSGSGPLNFGLGAAPGVTADGPGGRSVLRFDLGALPQNTVVEKAELKLSCKYPAERLICLYRLTSPWEQCAPPGQSTSLGATWTCAFRTEKGKVPWKTPGGDYDASTDWGQGPSGLVAQPVMYVMKQPVTLDVTGVVRAWVAGRNPNCGLLIMARDTNPPGTPWQGAFASSEDSVPEQRPTLTLTVVLPKR